MAAPSILAAIFNTKRCVSSPSELTSNSVTSELTLLPPSITPDIAPVAYPGYPLKKENGPKERSSKGRA
jgi:hypothetical protein